MGYEYTASVVKWRDRVNGNTYHSVRVIRHIDKAVLYCGWQYGNGLACRHTALLAMVGAGWIPALRGANLLAWERESGYPILWVERDGTKRGCIAHGRRD